MTMPKHIDVKVTNHRINTDIEELENVILQFI